MLHELKHELHFDEMRNATYLNTAVCYVCERNWMRKAKPDVTRILCKRLLRAIRLACLIRFNNKFSYNTRIKNKMSVVLFFPVKATKGFCRQFMFMCVQLFALYLRYFTFSSFFIFWNFNKSWCLTLCGEIKRKRDFSCCQGQMNWMVMVNRMSTVISMLCMLRSNKCSLQTKPLANAWTKILNIVLTLRLNLSLIWMYCTSPTNLAQDS